MAFTLKTPRFPHFLQILRSLLKMKIKLPLPLDYVSWPFCNLVIMNEKTFDFPTAIPLCFLLHNTYVCTRQ
jgi:hypothetical protein